MADFEEGQSLNDQVAQIERGIRTSVRFCVKAANGHCSGVWKFWANNSDFYIAARPIAGSIKLSLHESGIFRMALTQREIEAMRQRGYPVPDDRAVFKWRRPKKQPGMAVNAVTIRFPVAQIRGRPKKGTTKKPLITFDLVPECQVAEIGFFYTSETPEVMGPELEKIGEPLFYTQLRNGETVWVLGRFTQPKPRDASHPDQFASIPVEWIRRAAATDADITAIFANTPRDGEGLILREYSGLTVSDGARVVCGQGGS